MSWATAGPMPRSAIPSSSRWRSSLIRSGARLELMAWRSRSASAGVKPAQSMASCIICSWNSGTPSVLPSAARIDSCGIADVLEAVAAAQVGVDRAALDRARPDQRDLDDQVVELPRPQPGQGGHLGAGLDLEHAHRVRLGQHLVDGRVLLRDGGHRPVLAVVLGHEVEAVVQGGQHAQAEQVELDQARVGAVVLVPLQHGAAGHPGPLHRAHLPHRAVADHHAAGVDAEVTRQPLHLPGQLRHLRPGPWRGPGWCHPQGR